mgnify:CR=1 FL=1
MLVLYDFPILFYGKHASLIRNFKKDALTINSNTCQADKREAFATAEKNQNNKKIPKPIRPFCEIEDAPWWWQLELIINSPFVSLSSPYLSTIY